MDKLTGKESILTRLNTWLGIQVFKSKVHFYGQVIVPNGTISTDQLAFTPTTSTNIIATINVSEEGLDIAADRISISGTTTFASGYDPTGRIAVAGAAADVNANATTISGGKITTNSITTNQLNFTPVQSTDVIAKINASAEGITIEADNIAISGTTTFASGYDPTGRIAAGGAAADVNNGATTISGDKITTGTLDASAITAGTITADRITTGTITVNEMSFVPISPLGFGLPYIFGDASDGDATISSNTNYATGTLKQFNNLTINSGITLGCSDTEFASLFLMVSGTLTVNGTISVNGKGYAGGAGGDNGASQGGFVGTGATASYGGSGGGGGNADGGGSGALGGPTVQTSGAPAGIDGYSISTFRRTSMRVRSDLKDLLLNSWGSGGGGGGEDITYAGGSGGKGGGVLIIIANTIVVGASGVISANGADGTQGELADAGSGGGGGGGTILIVTRGLTNGGSIVVNGGTGPAGLGSGGKGGNGATGTYILEKIPY